MKNKLETINKINNKLQHITDDDIKDLLTDYRNSIIDIVKYETRHFTDAKWSVMHLGKTYLLQPKSYDYTTDILIFDINNEIVSKKASELKR